MRLPRSSGVLLHPTSLPSGRLDEEAYRFVDWLSAAGQSWWQVLPLGPPDESASPRRTGSRTGWPQPARALSTTRCASSASGRPSERTRASAGSASS
ncbi:MAG: 4-alpha-glucanotransferase, partial [Gaiellaceae bacterium]